MDCPTVAGISKGLSALLWLSLGLTKSLLYRKINYINFEAEDSYEETELKFSSNENDDDRWFINENVQEIQSLSCYIGSPLIRPEIQLRL